MLAIELVCDRETKEPAPDLATAVVEAAFQRGLLCLKSGIYANCIRVLVPLVITDSEAGRGAHGLGGSPRGRARRLVALRPAGI